MGRKVSCFYGDNALWAYYSNLGEKGRKEFLDWLNKIRLPSDRRSESINYDYNTDYRDDVYRAGDNIVYVYTNEFGIPFYVGKGSEMRAKSIYNRSDAFMEKLNDNGVCRIFAIVSNMCEEDSLEVETLVINELLNRGWRLTNSAKTAISSDKMHDLINTYPNVLESINNITSKGLDSLLDNADYFGESGKVIKRNKTTMSVATN